MSPTPRATSTAGRSLGVSVDSADSAALAGLALGLDAPSSELPSDDAVSATLRRGFDSGSAAGVGSSLRPLDAGSASAVDDELEGSSAIAPPPPPPGGFVLLKAPARRFQKVLLIVAATFFGSAPAKDSSPTTLPSLPVRTVSVALLFDTSPVTKAVKLSCLATALKPLSSSSRTWSCLAVALSSAAGTTT